MAYTKINRDNIYIDVNTQYLQYAHTEQKTYYPFIDFCKKFAGKRILDFGCATGGYCLALEKLNYDCVGVDVNEEFIKIAQQKGIKAQLIKKVLPFPDDSFDTVIMFELLEHVQNPDFLLKEAKRVAKKNILITVPNCENFEELGNYGLTYCHFLAMDHINFFTKKDLENLLSKHSDNFEVIKDDLITLEGEPTNPLLLSSSNIFSRFLFFPIRKLIALLWKTGMVKANNGIFKTKYYFRLYARINL